MKDNLTYLENLEEFNEDLKKFIFDFSYWFYDGFEEKLNGYLVFFVLYYVD